MTTIRDKTRAALARAVEAGRITVREHTVVLDFWRERDEYDNNPEIKMIGGYMEREERVNEIFRKANV